MQGATWYLTGGDYLAEPPETVRLGHGFDALCGIIELIGDAARFSFAQSHLALQAVTDSLCAAGASSEICGRRLGSRAVPR